MKSNRLTWQQAVVAGPAVVALLTALSIAYCYGLFIPFGLSWMAAFPVAELLSIPLGIAPVLVVLAIVGISTAPNNNLKHKLLADIPPQLVFFILFVLPALLIFYLLRVGDFSNDSLGLIVLGASAAIWPWALGGSVDSGEYRLALAGVCAVFGVFVMALFFGRHEAGARAHRNPPTYVRFTGGGAACQQLIHLSPTGLLLYDADTKAVTFVPRERVEALASVPICPAIRRTQPDN